jgi:hypothetical protein
MGHPSAVAARLLSGSPEAPESAAETGIRQAFLEDLALAS